MIFFPIIERELRVALRKHRPERRRWRLAAFGAGGSLLFIMIAALTRSPTAGRDLHQLLWLAGLYIILGVPRLAVGAFAQERKEQTLGLLFLSGLGPGEVFLSKLLSTAALAFADLLAIMPLLALPFLMGGISFELFIATVCSLPNLLLFALSVSLFASVLAEEDGAALLITGGMALLLCAGLPVIYMANNYFAGSGKTSSWWLLLSPGYGSYLVFARRTGAFSDFWWNFVITLAWSGFFLSAAAFFVRRIWRDRDNEGSSSWHVRWRGWVHGTLDARRLLAGRWLDTNPFAWLALRDSQPVALAWFAVGCIVIFWASGFALWPRKWASVPNFLIAATVLNLALRWIIHHTAAAGLGIGRRDGSYELLLTTPLEPRDIIGGQLEALRAQFRGLGRLVLTFEMLMMLAGLTLRGWDKPSLFVYLGVWAGLLFWEWNQSWNPRGALLSMWAGLNSAHPARAVWRTFGFNSWVWLWILYNMRHGVGGFQSFPAGTLIEVTVALCVLAALTWFLFQKGGISEVQEAKLIAEFREIVREPVPETNDPRFKTWNVRDRFPWGWQIIQQQLHERVVRRQRGNQ